MTTQRKHSAADLYDQGNRLAAAGNLEQAAAAYRAALVLEPDDAETHTNLGNVLLRLGRLAEAMEAYRAALARGLDHPLVHYNLGTALRALGQPDQALAAFERVREYVPGFASAHNNRGNALRDLGRYGEAAEAYLEALQLRPGDGGAQVNLASVLNLLHETDALAAGTLAQRWLAKAPDSAMARHVAVALTNASPPDRAADDYVRRLFDGFAADFDRQLTALDYRVPSLMAAALTRQDPEPAARLDVLDAGCGTGLCASALRPYARTLTGVDLSPEMLERARTRALYDTLEAAELTAFLTAHPNTFDLIVAADVLCYFGTLTNIFAALATALRPGGRVLFTVERGTEPGFTLQPNGRYRHHPQTLLTTLRASGLVAPDPVPVILRREGSREVEGVLVEGRQKGHP